MATSLCDSCIQPGKCCSGFVLTVFNANGPPTHPTFWVDEGDQPVVDYLKAKGLPFLPLETFEAWKAEDKGGREYRALRYRCPLIQADGRCGDYENRPQLCRDYQAGSDGLCAMYVSPGTDHPKQSLGGIPIVSEVSTH